MKTNYHTHTVRCHHAAGTDEEYVLAAISAGFDQLGFSDHTPYPFPDGYISSIRMGMDELEGYFCSISRLREQYKDDIQIFIGLEAEYFPSLFGQLLETLKGYPLDYMILGQHYYDSEHIGCYTGSPTVDEGDLRRYADQVIEGLRTGAFCCLAHPDLIHFVGDDAVYERHMSRICEAALELDIPLEVNMQGFSKGKWYPSDRFFRIARQTGNRLIFGYDAHSPQMLTDRRMMLDCLSAAGVPASRVIDRLF